MSAGLIRMMNDENRSITLPSRRQSLSSERLLSDIIPLQHYRQAPKSMSDEYSAVQQREVNDSKETATKHPRGSRRGMRRPQNFGWWWEFGAAFVAIASTAAIVAVLLKVDDRSISEWPWSIQPASLVSVFSTIAKAALLVPVAVCLSQLRWSYFEKPRELAHMQNFDDASRGPWGAAVFLWKTRGLVWLAGIGALVTVLATAFEPFSQQAIHFSERTLRRYNGTAWIGFTNDWSDSSNMYGAISAIQPKSKITHW